MRALKTLAILLTLIFIAAFFAYRYLENRMSDALGLDSPLPIVAGTPPGALIRNHPAWSGPSPHNSERPPETYHFPIPWNATGPIEPLFAGPKQYPFLCQTVDSGLGQSLVDNQQGFGVAVYQQDSNGNQTSELAGYSQDCSLPTRLHYFMLDEATANNSKPDFARFDDELPASIRQLDSDPQLLVRAETGTINRYIYVLLIPTTPRDQRDQPDLSRWNHKAVYHFKGAVGIGFQQGEARLTRMLRDMRTALQQGYAVLYSTGTETDYLYNAWIQEDTALRVKQQFAARYGQPLYTVGFGDSGGGLQQYLMAQNHPGLIDGGVAIIAYPDMVTQVTYGLDCELLEYYFDRLAPDPEFWRNPQHRSWIEGLSYSTTADKNELDYLTTVISLLHLRRPPQKDGVTECNHSWRGISANANNPHFNSHFGRYATAVNKGNFWTHWQDNRDVYGTDAEGRAQVPTGNTGVQYGLAAWRDGRISAAQFLDINRKVGAWKPQADMQQEHFWLASEDKGLAGLLRFSPWGEHNMTHNGKAMTLAPRSTGSAEAARGAWASGNVFQGEINIPIIDVRPYKDAVPDMHHSWSAISTRSRILARQGSNPWQSIWMSNPDYKARWDAFAALTRWLDDRAEGRYLDGPPDYAEDRCVDSQGQVLDQGDDVWNGAWNGKEDGACTRRMPFFMSSRQVAGDDSRASSLICPLITVDQAINAGFYAPLDVSPWAQQLREIFPNGVCDYRQSAASGI
jgi:hypothetical protein